MDNLDLIEHNDVAQGANGGTELLQRRLYDGGVPRELLKRFQIFFSRVRGEIDPHRLPILYEHDLAVDMEAARVLKDGGWKRFERIIFVSNWQKEQFMARYSIPPSKCAVILNSIHPIVSEEKDRNVIRLFYHSTPHRGLRILVPVFERLCQTYEQIELDVCSSFALYGRNELDKDFESLFARCRNHPKIRYHGAVSNDEVRRLIARAHIFGFPSIWPETSCLCLMEAMSAGLLCITPNLAALPETAANWAWHYNYTEDLNVHAGIFHHWLEQGILHVRDDAVQHRLAGQKQYADAFYNWKFRQQEWIALLQSIVATKTGTRG